MEIVEFKTAQLAQLCEFTDNVDYCYNIAEKHSDNSKNYIQIGSTIGDYELFAPTQSQLFNWLLTNKIHVQVDSYTTNGKVRFTYNVKHLGSQDEIENNESFNNYYSAFEKGLQEGLVLFGKSIKHPYFINLNNEEKLVNKIGFALDLLSELSSSIYNIDSPEEFANEYENRITETIDELIDLLPNRFEVFEEKFKPMVNPDEPSTHCIDDFSSLPYLKANYSINQIWTIVTSDNGLSMIIPGIHIVNREGYIITEIPWKEEDKNLEFYY